MDDVVPVNNRYKLGDYIKFSITSTTIRTEVKAILQKCWTTDGGSRQYILLDNR